jgi:heat shock protein HslJ
MILAQACFSVTTTESSSGATSTDLTSMEWRLVSVNVDDKPMTTESLKTPATLKINPDGQFSGQGGCNNFFGKATIKGSKIGFGNAGITKKMCFDNTVMALETAYMKALNEADSYEIKLKNLILKKGNNTIATFLSIQ